jgi:hypothetical protein
MAKATQPLSPYDSYQKSKWRHVLAYYLEASSRRGRSDEEIYALEDELERECAEIWQQPVRGLADLIVLASIAAHLNAHAGEPAYPYSAIAEQRLVADQRALAHLVAGVLSLAGVTVDGEGRVQLSQ